MMRGLIDLIKNKKEINNDAEVPANQETREEAQCLWETESGNKTKDSA